MATRPEISPRDKVHFVHEEDEFYPMARRIGATPPDIFTLKPDALVEFENDEIAHYYKDIMKLSRHGAANHQYVAKMAGAPHLDVYQAYYQRVINENIKPHFSTIHFANEVVAPLESALTIDASALGFSMALLFGSFIAFGAAGNTQVVDPLIGWIGVIFGITFMTMSAVHNRQRPGQ